MRFSTISALLGAAAIAAADETVTVTDLSITRPLNGGGVSDVSFKLDVNKGLSCNGSDVAFPTPVITCDKSDYRFALVPGEKVKYILRLYHDLGGGAGTYGEATVPCNGPTSTICEQVELGFKVTLDSK